MHLVLDEDDVDEGLERCRKHQCAGAVDDHQEEAAGHQPTPRLHKRPYLGPYLAQLYLRPFRGEVGANRFACVARRPISCLDATSAETCLSKATHAWCQCSVTGANSPATFVLNGARTPSRDEAAHAERRQDEAYNGHYGLLLNCSRMGQRTAMRCNPFLDRHEAGKNESEECDCHSDMHPEHAAARILCKREGAADDKHQTKP